MNNITMIVLVSFAGILLGIVFYGGLWLTVRKSIVIKNPAPWFLGSFLLRTSIIMTGFYYVSGGHWERTILCLLGFILARIVITILTRSTKGVAYEN